jgi:hypothetical protein
MTKIDKEFFEDYFKFDKIDKHFPKLDNMTNNIFENSTMINNQSDSHELVYEFAIYHPSKNCKTQQLSITGNSYFHELKDKIYCVLDEISSNNQSSFFFVENCFYNDLRTESNKSLSSKISESKIRKLNINSFKYDTNSNEENNKIQSKESSKYDYKKEFYISRANKLSEIYEEFSMGDYKINEIAFRIGYPYLYRHIDFCDHMIMLIDIRLQDRYDKFNDQTTLTTYQRKLKRRLCDTCLFYYAKFISINDPLGGNTNRVLFLCDFCLKKLHDKEFKENNVRGLKLIPYYHD